MPHLVVRFSLAVLLIAASACSSLPTGPDVPPADGLRLSKKTSDTTATLPDTSAGPTPQGGYINPNI